MFDVRYKTDIHPLMLTFHIQLLIPRLLPVSLCHQLAACELDPAGLGPDDHGLIVGLGQGVHQLELKVAQQDGPDGLDL
jgi:hypothetical protein